MLADHEAYARWPGMKVARLERTGETERNGKGAVRYLKSGPAWFREEITEFDRPTRMGYLIRESLLPIQHRGALLHLQDMGDGTTEVTWTSTFQVGLPLLGPVLARLLATQMSRGFGGALKHIDQTLARQA